MNNQFYRPGNSGFQYAKHDNLTKNINGPKGQEWTKKQKDEDLIIEENTIYEIDRECFERLKKQRKRNQ